MTYCSSLKDFQLENVLCDEAERAKSGGEVGKAALELYQEAREECLVRGTLSLRSKIVPARSSVPSHSNRASKDAPVGFTRYTA